MGFKVWRQRLATHLGTPHVPEGLKTPQKAAEKERGGGDDHSLSQRGLGGVSSLSVVSPAQVKTHLQAQTLAAVAVGHQHNHEVSGDGRGGDTHNMVWWPPWPRVRWHLVRTLFWPLCI